VADDCAYTNPPPLGAVQGPAGIRAVLEPFFAPTLENDFQILREAADGRGGHSSSGSTVTAWPTSGSSCR
jgi:limonene-1,2-epoxide hydrolase